MSEGNGTREVALVTGGERGLGRAITLSLANAGYAVVVNYLRNEEAAAAFRSELQAVGVESEFVRGDVTNQSDVASVVERALQRFGRIDVVVNNAGVTQAQMLKRMAAEDWARVIDVNLTGTFNVTRAVMPHMIERAGGTIVNIASVVGFIGGIGVSNYAASKAGVIGFTKSVALEVARHGITVNAICPGYFEAGMLFTIPEEMRIGIKERIPLGRFGNPEELGACVVFLARNGRYITGQSIHINGGLLMV